MEIKVEDFEGIVHQVYYETEEEKEALENISNICAKAKHRIIKKEIAQWLNDR